VEFKILGFWEDDVSDDASSSLRLEVVIGGGVPTTMVTSANVCALTCFKLRG